MHLGDAETELPSESRADHFAEARVGLGSANLSRSHAPWRLRAPREVVAQTSPPSASDRYARRMRGRTVRVRHGHRLSESLLPKALGLTSHPSRVRHVGCEDSPESVFMVVRLAEDCVRPLGPPRDGLPADDDAPLGTDRPSRGGGRRSRESQHRPEGYQDPGECPGLVRSGQPPVLSLSRERATPSGLTPTRAHDCGT